MRKHLKWSECHKESEGIMRSLQHGSRQASMCYEILTIKPGANK